MLKNYVIYLKAGFFYTLWKVLFFTESLKTKATFYTEFLSKFC